MIELQTFKSDLTKTRFAKNDKDPFNLNDGEISVKIEQNLYINHLLKVVKLRII